MYQNTLAVVLRAENYRDNDKMLTLFTQESGRVEALARGCRKTGSSLSPAASPFVCAEVQLYSKQNHTTLTQCRLKDSFYEIREDMDSFACGSLLLSICEKCIVPESPERRLFALLVNCLYALKKKADPVDTALFFALRLLSVLGQQIELDSCAVCGKGNLIKLDIAEGAAYCADCAGIDKAGTLGAKASYYGENFIRLLRLMQHSPVKSIIDTGFGAERSLALLFIEGVLLSIQAENLKSFVFFKTMLLPKETES